MKKIALIILLILSVISYGYATIFIQTVSVSAGAIGTIAHDGTPFQFYDLYQYHYPLTPSSAGTVQYGHIYITDGNTCDVCIQLTDNAGNEILSCAVSVGDGEGGTWYNCDAGSSTVLVSETTYYISVLNNDESWIEMGASDTNDLTLYYCAKDPYNCGDNIASLQGSTFGSSQDTPTVIWNNTSGSPE